MTGATPFTDSPQEVSADDFNRIFASGGVLDAFWTKQLAPLADTASNPWRYKPTEGNMTLQGPDLTPFQEAKQIRSVFFNGEGGKKVFLGDAGPRRGYGPGYHRTGD